jgi:hypothetical protein
MTTRIKLRRDTAANWTTTNPILAAGEPGLETDTGKVKYGNGTTPWTQLSYGGGDGATLTAEGNVVITAGSTEHWIATQRSQEGNTIPGALRYDSEGNLYSLTTTEENNDEYYIAVLTKYTAAGAIAWQKSFSECYPVALAIDSSDRAHISLHSEQSPVVTVMQFSATGTPGWKKEYVIGPVESFQGFIEEKSTTTLAFALTVFNGETFPGPTAVLIMEISIADGSVLLKKSIQLPGSDALVIATGIDVDPDENVFVTGYYVDDNDDLNKMFIEKLDEDLEPVWSKRLEAPNNYDMYGGDCASDALGNIYVVGTYNVETTNSNSDDSNFDDQSAGILTKLNSSGVVQWTRRLGPGPCGSWIAGLTATATGDVYLSSLTFAKKTGPLPGAAEYEREFLGQKKMIVARYDTQGAVVWQRYVDVANLEEEEYNSEGGPGGRGQAIAVFGDKFAVDGYGYSWNTTPFEDGQSADDEYDYFVVQLPTAGTALTIGDLSFIESRVPARFVTHTVADSLLTHENWDPSITAENSTLVADADTTVANNIVKSETYQYTFGADGTLTIPNDGDLKLTQTQVGWFIGIDSREDNDDIEGDCIAVDSQGNSYIGGDEDDDDRAFVMKVSPEGERLWSVTVYEDDNGDNTYMTALKIHPTTGNIMVLAEVSANYSYSVLFTLDQDTGRLLDVTEFKDSNADVYLNSIAWTSTGTYVLGGEKNGEFSPEYPVVPQTGSGTGLIQILRSAVPANRISTNWQIGGTEIAPFQNIAYIERYQNLTGTVREGSGATFDIINNGNGTYSAGTVNSGTNYLPGHKIKILGTSLPGAENTSTFTAGAEYTVGQVAFDSQDGLNGPWSLGIDSTLTNITSLITTGTTLTLTVGTSTVSTSVVSTGGEFNGFTLYQVGDLSSFGTTGTTIDSITVGLGTYASGATPDNDIVITVQTVGSSGNITGVGNSGTAAGTFGATATAVTGTNYEVGSGFTFNFEGPRDSTDYGDNQVFNPTNFGSNYTNGDVITVLGTSLGGASPANNMTFSLQVENGQVQYAYNVAGTSQTSTWKIETTAQVDFAGTGSWSITYSQNDQCLLVTPTWQRIFGTDTDASDSITTLTVDSQDNIIAVGDGFGELAADDFEDLAVVYKFNSAGTLQWVRQLNTESNDAEGHSVVTIGTDIYVVHENDDGDSFVSKLDSTGTVKWQRRTEGQGITIARTPDGNLLVAVEDDSSETITTDEDYAIKIFLLTPAGETVWKRWLSPNIDYDAYIGSSGECLFTDTNSFYITGRNNSDGDDWAWAARLPLDGSGTGEYGQFCYTDVNTLINNNAGLYDFNYNIDVVDIDNVNNYAGPLSNSSDPLVSTATAVTVTTNNINDYDVSSYYPPIVVETVQDTDGGHIVFADGSHQSTSATDVPQRLFNGIKYTLGMKDRGHHILCTDDLESIRIPYNSRVEFPIGTVITIVNPRGDGVVINTEGSSIQVMIPGDSNYSNGGTFLVSEYGMATLLKIGTDQWVLAGNVGAD